MPIDIAEVRRIAALARLDLDEATVARYRHQLDAILDYIAMLEELEVEGTAVPAADPSLPRRELRPDRRQPGLTRDEALSNAPDAANGMFRVPRVLEG